MKEINGYKESFYILGKLCYREFIGEDGYYTEDPTKSKKFNTYREAANYYDEHSIEYGEKLYPQEIQITVEYL